MRRRLLQGIAAAALAIAVVVPGTAQPAQAIDLATIKKYIDIARSAYNQIKSLLDGGSESEIQAAVRQIIAAIEASKTEILSHVDALASAPARACARHHVIEFNDIEQFSPSTLQTWAQDVTGCVTLIESLIDVVDDKAQVDLLGLALNSTGPIALAARVKAGFSTSGVFSVLRDGNLTLIDKLAPVCTRTTVREPGAPVVEIQYSCVAYNGDTGFGLQVCRRNGCTAPINEAAVQDQATRGTSRAVAREVLPTL
jgi:hypothetical protein